MGQVSTESKARVEEVLRHAVADPILLEAGRALVDNDIPHAEALLRDRLRRSPTDVAAIRMLAEVAARIGRYEDAAHLLERCLELVPGFHAARQNYAMVLHRGNRPQEALAQVERLLAEDPGNPGYRNLRAVVLCRTGDFGEAIELYEDILAEHPDQARVWLSQGHALKTSGLGERAIAAYRRCLELDPGFGDAWWSLANLKTFRFDDADIAAMRAQLQRTDLDDEHRLHLDFALGKALEDRGEYAGSFAHYSRGNALRLARVPYSADATSARLQRAAEIYTAEFFRERAGFGVAARVGRLGVDRRAPVPPWLSAPDTGAPDRFPPVRPAPCVGEPDPLEPDPARRTGRNGTTRPSSVAGRGRRPELVTGRPLAHRPGRCLTRTIRPGPPYRSAPAVRAGGGRRSWTCHLATGPGTPGRRWAPCPVREPSPPAHPEPPWHRPRAGVAAREVPAWPCLRATAAGGRHWPPPPR